MIRALENAELVSDLDCDGFEIKNPGELHADNLVSSDDPRLNDPRVPPAASVTNEHVNRDAAIAQSKLNLNDALPLNFLAPDILHAARGDLTEYLSRKGTPGGYAGLDSGRKIPAASIPISGTGTLVDLLISLPGQFSLSPSRVTDGSVTMAATWAASPSQSFFGNNTGTARQPQFAPLIPVSLVPPLPAGKFVSGVFSLARLPTAIGTGTGHATGLVTDPGLDGQPDDYLARDMTYKPMRSEIDYQPKVSSPSIALLGYDGSGDPVVDVNSPTPGGVCFYRHDLSPGSLYSEVSGPVSVQGTVRAYAVKTGYTQSDMAIYTPPATTD
jgi:hypothetical protein